MAAIPFFLILIAILLVLRIPGSFEPPYLFLILNIIFTGIIPLAIAVIAFRSCQRNPSIGILFIGIGMLIFGISSIAAPPAMGLPGGRNISLTIHNTAALACALCQLAAGAVLLSGIGPRNAGMHTVEIGIMYGIAGIFIALLIVATTLWAMPVYFLLGTGYMILREGHPIPHDKTLPENPGPPGTATVVSRNSGSGMPTLSRQWGGA